MITVLTALSSCGMNYAVTGNYNLNTTQVQLSSANFNVLEKVSGSADVSYVFMIGGINDHQLYENAYSAMMSKANLSKGPRAICNVVTEEQVSGFVPFYYTRTITVSANVVEFTR